MVNWQVTATTIYCDAVDDEVTLLVNKDWSVKCTGHPKYSKTNKGASNLLKKKKRQLRRALECEGPECKRAIQYRDKLKAEESQTAAAGKPADK
jgi:hypothetical protein